jgi:cytochrome b561
MAHLRSEIMNSQFPLPKSDTTRYTVPAIFLHWVSALVIAAMLPLGWYMMSVEEVPGSRWLFGLHQSIGVLFAAMLAFRVAWRTGHRPHALPDSVPGWQLRVAHAVHASLYVAMIAMPLTGIAGAMLDKEDMILFGFAVPHLFASRHNLAEILFEWHGAIAAVLAYLIGIHVVAAIKHLIVDKNDVFQRMWFRG